MSKIRIFAFIALITLAFGVALVGGALAGEKVKGRTVWYTVKWEQISVPGEEKHLIALADSKGISSNTEGKTFGEGTVERSVGLFDIDLETGLGSSHGYQEATDREGDKIYYRWEGKRIKGKLWGSLWECKLTILRGTGKYEGIRGRGAYSMYPIAPMQSYTDWEMDVELPR